MNHKLPFKILGYLALMALGHGLISLLLELEPPSSSHGTDAGIAKGLGYVYLNLWYVALLLLGSLIKLVMTLRTKDAAASIMGYLYFPLTVAHVFVAFWLVMLFG